MWEECVTDNNYEIYSVYPYNIRRKKTQRLVKEYIHKKDGTYRLRLSCKEYPKHRIIADQWIKKDNPNQCIIKHINKDKLNNRVSNLQWVDSIWAKPNMRLSITEMTDYGCNIFEDTQLVDVSDFFDGVFP